MCAEAKETEALNDYTEPVNTRVVRKADALPPHRRERFKVIRQRHFPLAALNFMFHSVALDTLVFKDDPPSLLLRASTDAPFGNALAGVVPDDVLDAPALWSLMEALIEHSQRATAEFDEVFGERV